MCDPEADPVAVLVRYHTPNVYRAVVAWYAVVHVAQRHPSAGQHGTQTTFRAGRVAGVDAPPSFS